MVKLDAEHGRRVVRTAGPGRHLGEAVFVPAVGSTREGDGYLITSASDLAADASELLVLDAGDLTTTATVHLPRRVPSGIHGSSASTGSTTVICTARAATSHPPNSKPPNTGEHRPHPEPAQSGRLPIDNVTGPLSPGVSWRKDQS